MDKKEVHENLRDKFSDNITTDRNALDDEWERHGDLVFECGIMLTEAIQERDTIQRKLDRCYGKLANAVRKNPGEFGIVGRVTDKSILGAAALDSEYDQLTIQLIEIGAVINTLKSYDKALASKQKGLDRITDLYFRNYFARKEPKPEARAAFTEEGSEAARRTAAGKSRLKLKTPK